MDLNLKEISELIGKYTSPGNHRSTDNEKIKKYEKIIDDTINESFNFIKYVGEYRSPMLSSSTLQHSISSSYSSSPFHMTSYNFTSTTENDNQSESQSETEKNKRLKIYFNPDNNKSESISSVTNKEITPIFFMALIFFIYFIMMIMRRM
jgi:hypothetical protein